MNSTGCETDGQAALASMARLLACEPEKIEPLLAPEEWARLEGLLRARTPSAGARLVRRWAPGALRRLPFGAQRAITGIVKRGRGFWDSGASAAVSELTHVKVLSRLAAALDGGEGWPATRSATVCLTHDIDWEEGYRVIETIASLEREAGIRSTFNVLVNGPYRLDASLLKDLVAEGFEIGLHGWDHDPGIAYRSRATIRDWLNRACDGLPVPVAGFRAPALSASPILMEVLEELGFKYDSSLPVRHPWYPNVETIYPYPYPGLGLWEVPLALQDDYLFREHRLSDQEALDVVIGLVEEFAALGGVFVFNGHPGILHDRLDFYRLLLQALGECGHLRPTLLRDVVEASA